MFRKLLSLLVVVLAPVMAFAQYNETGWPVVTIGSPAPSFTRITTSQTWLAGHVYHLQGVVAVDSGVTITIQPGTIVKGDPGQAANVSTILFGPGSKIMAQGSAALPIIFTTFLDNVGDTSDIPDVASSRGLWGGVIMCGRAFTCAAGGTSIMEGIPDSGRITRYGGGLTPDCHDNSGVLSYVSIRYAGSIFTANVEVNCLSLGAIGDGTQINHIDTYYGLDDDIENWGGSVNLYYTTSFYGDDDCYDVDECWSGVRQFALEVKDPRWGDRLSESDGRQQAVWSDTTSMASPAVPSGWGCNYPSYAVNLNVTALGQGVNFSGPDGNRQIFRENYRGYWYNNVFMEQPKTAVDVDCPGGDVNIDNQPSATRNLPSGAASLGAGFPQIDFVSNFWFKSYNKPSLSGSSLSHFVSNGGGAAAIARVQGDIFPAGDTEITGKNFLVDPQVVSYETVNPPVRHEIIDLRPLPGGTLASKAPAVLPGYVTTNHGGAIKPANYIGAFAPNQPMWAQSPYVAAYQYKVIPNTSADTCACAYLREGKPVVVIGSPAPSFTRITADRILTADTIWHLKGVVAVDSGHTLSIEPGTTIKADPGQAANVTTLIISPGARLIALGTKCKPIIFTTFLDNVDDPNDIPDVASSRGLWGGIIMEGRAFTCAAGGTSIMEGIPDSGRITRYGGGLNPDCHDNSGILQYISIRYAGSIFAANVEVNCLSLGAIGDGTIIDHIETYYGLDDDIELWGGNVNVYYTCSLYGDDDCYDVDECWTGVQQFGFEIKDPRWGDRLTETDGRQQAVWSDTTSMASPAVPSGWGCNYPGYAVRTNLTCIGQGKDFSGPDGNRQIFRENLRSYWYNNIFMEQPKTAVDVDCPGGDANIDAQPSSTRNLPSGAASLSAGHPLLDLVSNFWYKSYNKPSLSGSSLSHFVSNGGGPLAIARVQNDLFPGGDTTLTGKNFLINPELSSYETVNPPVRHAFINPVPRPGGNAAGKAAAVLPAYVTTNHGGAITPTTFVGAFDPAVNIKNSWVWGWTAASTCYGILGDTVVLPGCCVGSRGNVDCDPGQNVDIADLTVLVDNLFISFTPLCCTQEADVVVDNSIDIADLTALVDNLFISFAPLPGC